MMPVNLSDIRRKQEQSVGRSISEISADFYQTKKWRQFREKRRQEMREYYENVIMKIYENTPDATPNDLYQFMVSDKKYPLCEECLRNDKITVGNTLDHIKRITEGGAKLSANNTQWLCRECHDKKRAKESLRDRGYSVD